MSSCDPVVVIKETVYNAEEEGKAWKTENVNMLDCAPLP